MTDTKNWDYIYKIKNGEQEGTNLLYSPTTNNSKDILCMSWDLHDPYQSSNTNLDQDLIDFFFDREVRYLNTFKDRQWAPEIYKIDLKNKK